MKRGALYGLIAAALFGASAPFSKRLLPGVEPLVLSGILYLGAGAALWLFSLARAGSTKTAEAKLRRGDLPTLGLTVLFGGVLGPFLLLAGLTRVTGIAGSLLLNFEGVFTVAIAMIFFGEHLPLREIGGMILVLAGGVFLSAAPGASRADAAGALLVAGACLCWALDNNLTQRLSGRDPVSVSRAKTTLAGAASLALAALLREPVPAVSTIAAGALLGAICYGASIVFFVYALRLLGAARQSAYFATAPFAGAIVAIPVLGSAPTLTELGASLVMAGGVVLILRAKHSHRHRHEALEHEHVHTHDEHHQHAHEGPVSEPHSHPHRHEPMEHEHPHVSDAHHRHSHREPE